MRSAPAVAQQQAHVIGQAAARRQGTARRGRQPGLPARPGKTCCSRTVAAGAWSNESIDSITALWTTSAAKAGISGGQCRCAAVKGWDTATELSMIVSNRRSASSRGIPSTGQGSLPSSEVNSAGLLPLYGRRGSVSARARPLDRWPPGMPVGWRGQWKGIRPQTQRHLLRRGTGHGHDVADPVYFRFGHDQGRQGPQDAAAPPAHFKDRARGENTPAESPGPVRIVPGPARAVEMIRIDDFGPNRRARPRTSPTKSCICWASRSRSCSRASPVRHGWGCSSPGGRAAWPPVAMAN